MRLSCEILVLLFIAIVKLILNRFPKDEMKEFVYELPFIMHVLLWIFTVNIFIYVYLWLWSACLGKYILEAYEHFYIFANNFFLLIV